MKRTLSIITLFSILLTACVGDPGPPGFDGLDGQDGGLIVADAFTREWVKTAAQRNIDAAAEAPE